MNVKLTTLALVVLVGGSARLASAQYQQYPQPYPPQYIPSYSGYGMYDHASTLEEGMANGIANIMHAAGASNLLHAQAARQYQEARSAAIDNRVKGLRAFQEFQKVRQDNVAAARAARPTQEQVVRYAKDRAPSRLGVNELDPLTGRVLWPAVLEDSVFQANREQLDELVFKWVRFKGRIGPEEYLALQRNVKAMETELKRHIKDYPSADYVKAKTLLASLTYEVVRVESALAKGEEPGTIGPLAGKLAMSGESGGKE